MNKHPTVQIRSLEDIAAHFETLAAEAALKMKGAKPVAGKVLLREHNTLKACAAFVRYCRLDPTDDEISVLFTDNVLACQWLIKKGFICSSKDGWTKNDSRAIIQSHPEGWLVTVYTTRV